MLKIRNANPKDLPAMLKLHQAVIEKHNDTDKKNFAAALQKYPNHIWLLERDGTLVSMVLGPAGDEEAISSPRIGKLQQNAQGDWQYLYGAETHPDFRAKGYASILLKEVIKNCKDDGRTGITVLTLPKDEPFYAKLGFQKSEEKTTVTDLPVSLMQLKFD
jgi:ribosomal protein S18 acetylase RimI-like enzyme